MAAEFAGRKGSLHLVAMNAAHMGFRDRTFDLTLCSGASICSSANWEGTTSRRLLAKVKSSWKA